MKSSQTHPPSLTLFVPHPSLSLFLPPPPPLPFIPLSSSVPCPSLTPPILRSLPPPSLLSPFIPCSMSPPPPPPSSDLYHSEVLKIPAPKRTPTPIHTVGQSSVAISTEKPSGGSDGEVKGFIATGLPGSTATPLQHTGAGGKSSKGKLKCSAFVCMPHF